MAEYNGNTYLNVGAILVRADNGADTIDASGVTGVSIEPRGDAGPDSVNGGDFAELIKTQDADTVYAGDGDGTDTLTGGAGSDKLFTGNVTVAFALANFGNNDSNNDGIEDTDLLVG